jgi:hypothetical protein
MGNKQSGNRTGQARAPGAGRPPQSITLRIGDGIAFRYGVNTPLELGEVAEIKRGIPRTVVIQLRESGERIWLLVETPKEH